VVLTAVWWFAMVQHKGNCGFKSAKLCRWSEAMGSSFRKYYEEGVQFIS